MTVATQMTAFGRMTNSLKNVDLSWMGAELGLELAARALHDELQRVGK